MKNPFKKKKQIALEAGTADQILQNVFAKTNATPNTIPLDVLTSYSNYRKDRYALQRTVLVIVLVLFLMLPLVFIGPEVYVQEIPQDTPGSAVYNIQVDTLVPIARVTATIDGRNMPVYEMAAKEFSVEPMTNGHLVLTVTLVNGQIHRQTLGIEDVDMDAPVLVSSDYDDDNIYLYLSDAGSGLALDKIRGIGNDGTEYRPVKTDAETGMVAFAYPKEPMNIFVSDQAGNTLQLVISFSKS